jgi:DNA-binding transcriptional ArsR family regulator
MPRPYAIVPVKAAGVRDLGAAACVYIALCAFADDRTGECFPSQRRIAEMTGLRREHVQRQIAKLAQMGLVEVRRRHREDGGKAANRYRIILDPHVPDLGGAHVRDLGDQREPEKDLTLQFEEEGDTAADWRSAPLHSTSERGSLPQPQGQASVHNQAAYDAEVAARKRRNWLQNLYVWVTDHLRGEERWRAWETITAATEAGSRAATPKVSTRLLDELDRRRRGEATRRGGSAA